MLHILQENKNKHVRTQVFVRMQRNDGRQVSYTHDWQSPEKVTIARWCCPKFSVRFVFYLGSQEKKLQYWLTV